MSDLIPADRRASERGTGVGRQGALVELDRTAERAAERLRACRCGDRPHLLLVRSFDGASRDRADRVRRQVRAHLADVDVTTRPGPVTPGGADLAEHCCLLVDLSSGPSVTATLGWSWRPNQPERGVLGLTLDGLGEVVLQPGQSVTVRPGRHLLEVEVAAEVGGRATRVRPAARTRGAASPAGCACGRSRASTCSTVTRCMSQTRPWTPRSTAVEGRRGSMAEPNEPDVAALPLPVVASR